MNIYYYRSSGILGRKKIEESVKTYTEKYIQDKQNNYVQAVFLYPRKCMFWVPTSRSRLGTKSIMLLLQKE